VRGSGSNTSKLALATLIASASACGSEGGPGRPLPVASMTIVNESNFNLQELRLHQTPDFMAGTSAFPGGAMKINAELVLYGEGDWYVTAIHPVVAGTKPLAFTTQTPIAMTRGSAYELIVFDQSFRLKMLPRRVEPEDLDGRPSFGDPGPSSERLPGTSTTTTSTRSR
jgi:hypothetical protein